MLCDRENTNVPATQPGFINFVTFPLYQTLSSIAPRLLEIDGCIDRMKENKKKWSEYKETEEDKQIYTKKLESRNPSMRLTKTMRLSHVVKFDEKDL